MLGNVLRLFRLAAFFDTQELVVRHPFIAQVLRGLFPRFGAHLQTVEDRVFHLVDSWSELDENRRVFKFKLIAVEDEEDLISTPVSTPVRRRVIPTAVKLAVWKRDGGKCVECGADDELHFDHDLPWSKGGTSITEANVQLLCARHNLQKSDQIL